MRFLMMVLVAITCAAQTPAAQLKGVDPLGPGDAIERDAWTTFEIFIPLELPPSIVIDSALLGVEAYENGHVVTADVDHVAGGVNIFAFTRLPFIADYRWGVIITFSPSSEYPDFSVGFMGVGRLVVR